MIADIYDSMAVMYVLLFLLFVGCPVYVLLLILFRGDVMLRNIGKAGDAIGHALYCDGPETGYCNSSVCRYPPRPRLVPQPTYRYYDTTDRLCTGCGDTTHFTGFDPDDDGLAIWAHTGKVCANPGHSNA